MKVGNYNINTTYSDHIIVVPIVIKLEKSIYSNK